MAAMTMCRRRPASGMTESRPARVIFVDDLRRYPTQAARKGLPSEWWCHMISDLPGKAGEQELLDFANGIGLRERWIQRPGTAAAHFDLPPWSRDDAVQAGATQVSTRELVERIALRRREI
jgi:hypothetical protein